MSSFKCFVKAKCLFGPVSLRFFFLSCARQTKVSEAEQRDHFDHLLMAGGLSWKYNK